jgi:hypothetical protein
LYLILFKEEFAHFQCSLIINIMNEKFMPEINAGSSERNREEVETSGFVLRLALSDGVIS